MFVLPPRPPVDYKLTDVPFASQSCLEFTPDHIRVTQPNIGQFLVPIYDDKADVSDIKIEPIHPRVLNNWALHFKQDWVIRPGEDAYFLHDMFKKFTVKRPSYRDRVNEVPFPRSYKYELECVEDRRLQILREKVAREEHLKKEKERKEIVKKEAAEDTFPGMVPCKEGPPFWWRTEGPPEEAEPEADIVAAAFDTTYTTSFKRWQDDPGFFLDSASDECKRKAEMRVVGQPFKHEATNYYYVNYPGPDIKWRPEKFSG